MAIQTTPTNDQAADYLTATAAISVREMSRPMYKLLNSCARVMQRTYPGLAGYYDPEFNGRRIDLTKHLHRPASVTAVIPQSPRLLELTAAKYPDPWANVSALFGL